MTTPVECPVARRSDAEEEAVSEVELMCASANKRANWIEQTLATVVARVGDSSASKVKPLPSSAPALMMGG